MERLDSTKPSDNVVEVGTADMLFVGLPCRVAVNTRVNGRTISMRADSKLVLITPAGDEVTIEVEGVE